MRDFVLNDCLGRLAAEAATRFTTLVASGEQIPFDVSESAGPESIFHSYRPLTAEFVRQRAAELRSLPSFEQSREAVDAAGVAAPYLERQGEAVPADPAERAERMLVAFFATVWEGCTEFSLDRARLEEALASLDADARDVHDAALLLVPIAGLRLAAPRLRLTDDLDLVRADAIEAPLEALWSEGMQREAWEPQILAVAEQTGGEESATTALRRLRQLVSAMRIFKPGGVALGPFAFAPTGEGCWRRLATGAAPARRGRYQLGKDEADGLGQLLAALEERGERDGALAWALHRFELGCEREAAVFALSDHLLALRAMLEGHGPVGATLAMRAAALIASDPEDRSAAHERIERAIEVESAVMRGGRPEGADELAEWLEHSLREILRSAALGELGGDLGVAADETLIATGLAEGDAQISVSVEVQPDPEPDPEPGSPARTAWDREIAAEYVNAAEEEQEMDEQETRILEPIPDEDEIKITATDWLEEVPESGNTLEWPAGSGEAGRRERVDSPRVRHLFPVPDADWEIRELDYDHYNRRAG